MVNIWVIFGQSMDNVWMIYIYIYTYVWNPQNDCLSLRSLPKHSRTSRMLLLQNWCGATMDVHESRIAVPSDVWAVASHRSSWHLAWNWSSVLRGARGMLPRFSVGRSWVKHVKHLKQNHRVKTYCILRSNNYTRLCVVNYLKPVW